MDLGSIAGMFDPPYGVIVKTIIATASFGPIAMSTDFGFQFPMPM